MTYNGVRVYAYTKSEMYAGRVHPTAVSRDIPNSSVDTLWPARGSLPTGTGYFITADNAGAIGSTVSVYKWSLAGQYYNGTIYGAHTIGCNPGTGTVACVQWYQVKNLDTTPQLAQQGTLGTNGEYRYFPNLATDAIGNLGIAYAFSSAPTYAGIRYTGHLATDSAGTLQPEATLKAGGATINGARYGDFAGTTLDPNGVTIWHFEEYTRAGSLWGTWVGSFSFGTAPPPTTTTTTTTTTTLPPTTTTTTLPVPDFTISATPTSRSIHRGQSTTYTITVARQNGFAGNVTLSVGGLRSGWSGSFSPNPAVATSTELTITTTATATRTTATLTITGVGGGKSRTTTVTLTVRK